MLKLFDFLTLLNGTTPSLGLYEVHPFGSLAEYDFALRSRGRTSVEDLPVMVRYLGSTQLV